MHPIRRTYLLLLFLLLTPLPARAQSVADRVDALEWRVSAVEQEAQSASSRVTSVNSDVSRLDRDVEGLREELADFGPVLFLFGAFCALWAQNTRRNAWLWFFMGLIFHVITVLVLLAANADDRQKAARVDPQPG